MSFFTKLKINRILKQLRVLRQNRVNNQPSDDVLRKEMSLYLSLAAIYRKLLTHKKYPFARISLLECLKAAGDLESADAHFQAGELLLQEARFREGLVKDGVLKSTANDMRIKEVYEEAHAHLKVSEKLGSIAGKRLRGLSIINGWGVPADKDAGFELVVSSIEQEGSWDRVPQIFASIGLNKPEFFSAIMQRKK